MSSIILTLTFLVIGTIFGNALPVSYEAEEPKDGLQSLQVINGDFTTINMFPIDVAFLIANNIWGVGVIVKKNWILTTAFNCLWVDPTYISVRVKSSNWTTGGSVIPAEECIMHPDYIPGTYANNIALVKLRKNISFGKKAKLANYKPKASLKVNGTSYPVSGWGVRSSNYKKENQLQTIQQTILSDEECSKSYNLTAAVGSFCATNENGGPCVFDFGAPLSKNQVVIGLYQGSTDCTQPQAYPALYVDVYLYREWINNTINQ